MQCPECGPSKDYDLLYHCQDCGRGYCQIHNKSHDHGAQASAPITGHEILDQFKRSVMQQMQQQTREPTDQEYEAFLRHNPRILTSGRESIDLLLGLGLIAWVFGFRPILDGFRSWQYVLVLTLIIGPAFILHELAHKYMAIHYGKYARFALMRQMAMFTFFAGLIGIPIAGPGATMILGRSTERESGIFSAVGPASNFVLAGISYLLYLLTPSSIFISAIGEPLSWIFILATFINSVLGVFNLLPFGALDGAKILNWNVLVWISLVVVNVPFIYLSFPIAFG